MNNWKRLSVVPLLAAALWVAGCSDRSIPADRLLGPDEAAFAKSADKQAEKAERDAEKEARKAEKQAEKEARKAEKAKIKVTKKDGVTQEYSLVQGVLPNKEKSKKRDFDSKGGKLTLAGHTLVVPEGAVSQPTEFSMRVFNKVVDKGGPGSADNEVGVGVDLTATTYYCDAEGYTADGGYSADNADFDRDGIYECTEINIGEKGFGVPVELTLSYAWATNVSDPSELMIVWAQTKDLGEEVSSIVEVSKHGVTGLLEHFSRYLLAIP